ncbi:zinc-alpha-2-glycoprotein-like [Pseudorasbora parva]|uniref:zinc-alpha-2-glycoprotein-like n=1 Tax=Pseudorasbora parva TaxID=51549 RepID=UPI00351E8130
MHIIVLTFVLYTSLLPVLSEKHLLQYVYTAFTKPGSSGLEFSAVGLYDDRRISHYSNEEQTWKRDGLNAEICRDFEEPHYSKGPLLNLLYTLANCTRSKCDGLHTLQRRFGCEDAVMNVNVFNEYRYDGEDFIAFNFSTTQWMGIHPKAKETKMKWDADRFRNRYLQSNLKICMTWISTCNDSEQNAPDVHMFASEASHDRSKLNLTCLATGFYPKLIEMKITLNGVELKPFRSTGVRPNDDETFQMRISVEIHRDEKKGYECHVRHSSQTQTNTTSWDGTCNRCSEVSRRHDCAVAAVGAVSIAVVLLVWSKIYKRKSINRQNCNGSNTRSESLLKDRLHSS